MPGPCFAADAAGAAVAAGLVVDAAGAAGFVVGAAGFVAGAAGFVVGACGFAVVGFCVCVAGFAGGVCAAGDAANAKTHSRLSSDLVMSNSLAATSYELPATS